MKKKKKEEKKELLNFKKYIYINFKDNFFLYDK